MQVRHGDRKQRAEHYEQQFRDYEVAWKVKIASDFKTAFLRGPTWSVTIFRESFSGLYTLISSQIDTRELKNTVVWEFYPSHKTPWSDENFQILTAVSCGNDVCLTSFSRHNDRHSILYNSSIDAEDARWTYRSLQADSSDECSSKMTFSGTTGNTDFDGHFLFAMKID